MFAVVISIMIAVAVAIAIAIASAQSGSIKNDGHVLEFAVFYVSVKVGYVATVKYASSHNKQGAVGILLNDACVSKSFGRRTVDEDKVVLRAHIIDKRLHTLV